MDGRMSIQEDQRLFRPDWRRVYSKGDSVILRSPRRPKNQRVTAAFAQHISSDWILHCAVRSLP